MSKMQVIFILLAFFSYNCSVGIHKTRNGYSLHKNLLQKTGFHSSTRALAVTNLCFWIPTEQLQEGER